MVQRELSYEVIFVEDSGWEASWKQLLQLKKRFPEELRIIKLSRNFGQNGATLCGIDEARGEKVITIDDDLQIPPSEIAKLIDKQEETGADVVYGKMPEKRTSWLHLIGARLIKGIFNFQQGGTSIGSSFRLIDKHVVERLRFHSQDHLFINQVITWYTLEVVFVEVEQHPRGEGRSGYSLWKLIMLSFRLIFYYTSIPLKLVVTVCALTALACFSLAIYYWSQALDLANKQDIITIVLMMAIALVLGSVSILGTYVNRIYTSRVRKPNYSIKLKL
jgi:glycosyltransferase involved in cell wall biosynthesis